MRLFLVAIAGVGLWNFCFSGGGWDLLLHGVRAKHSGGKFSVGLVDLLPNASPVPMGGIFGWAIGYLIRDFVSCDRGVAGGILGSIGIWGRSDDGANFLGGL